MRPFDPTCISQTATAPDDADSRRARDPADAPEARRQRVELAAAVSLIAPQGWSGPED
jgi:hypothetical protein